MEHSKACNEKTFGWLHGHKKNHMLGEDDKKILRVLITLIQFKKQSSLKS